LAAVFEEQPSAGAAWVSVTLAVPKLAVSPWVLEYQVKV
jgi:hypothetical protein